MSPEARSSWLLSNRDGWPVLLTETFPVTALTPPALAEIPKRSRFCPCANVANETNATNATNVLSMLMENFIAEPPTRTERFGESGAIIRLGPNMSNKFLLFTAVDPVSLPAVTNSHEYHSQSHPYRSAGCLLLAQSAWADQRSQ